MPRVGLGYLGCDVETTGVDKAHGARPYFVSLANERWENSYWEWDVDPVTRKVRVVKADTEEIAHELLNANGIVFHGGKFDIGMLSLVLPKDFVWPWDKIHDTIFSCHVLGSNHLKDLNTAALEYLSVDLSPYEDALEVAVKNCRNMVRLKNGPIRHWRIAKEGLPDMPSAGKEKVWKYDTWLPRAVAKRKIKGYQEGWMTVAAEYANPDPITTLALHLRHKQLLKDRGLWEIYLSRLELLPSIVDMESKGVTASRKRQLELETAHTEIKEKTNRLCVNIAKSYGSELTLPKNGRNNSLDSFIFNDLKLPPVKVGNERKKKDKSKPTLDKKVLQYYEATLKPRSKPHVFVTNLINNRAANTSLGYQSSYKKFWLPMNVGNDGEALLGEDLEDFRVLYPSLNPTATSTLRWTSSSPNEQQISKREGFNLRYIFGPGPGREWWSLDAKNIELRIPAYESGERELINLFENPDEPPYYGSTHLVNFHTVYPELWEPALKQVGIEKVGPYCKKVYAASWYQWIKNFGFAVQYGAQERDDGDGTADIAAHKPGAHALVKERFAKLEVLNRKWINFAEHTGYVETIPDRTINPKKGYPLLCTRDGWGKIKPTVPLAYHVQGTAMWWTSRAMIRVYNFLQEYNRGKPPKKHARLVMQVHDEIVLDFPRGSTHEENLPMIREIARLMAVGGDDIGIPTPVGIEYHDNNWATGLTLAA